MSLTIPNLPDEPYHSLRVRLEGQDYSLELLYSTRGGTYSLNILDEELKPIAMGLKLFTGVPLLASYKRDSRLPTGDLYVVALGADQTPPALGELGAGLRCELTYFTLAELQAAVAG